MAGTHSGVASQQICTSCLHQLGVADKDIQAILQTSASQ
jgi:hypothetical protein